MPFVLRPPGAAPPPLTERLAGLGRARKLAAVAGGAFTLAAVVAAAVGAACALDFALHLPPVVRAGALAGTLTAAGVLYLRGVRGPAREPAGPLAVAHRLEARFPRLNDALASAVEFLAADGAAADRLGSARFRRVAVVRAQNLAGRHDLAAIVPAGRAWRAFFLAGLAVTVVGLVAVLNPGRTALALVRLADPYGRHPWPTRTTLTVREPAAFPVRHARGDPFELKFDVRGVIPEHAAVQVRLAGGPVADAAVALTLPTDPNADAVPGELRLDAGRVPRDFELRVVANDADTGWLGVTVAPPPVLVPLDGRPSPQVRLDYPAYTDLPPADLPNGTGVVEAVAGTRVALRAAADRPIAAAVVRPQFDLAPAHAAAAAAGLATPHPLGAAAARLLASEATADVPVRVSGPDGTRLEAVFTPRLPGLYALRFTDETGLTGVRLLDVRVFPDPAPAVALSRPDPARDPLTLLPTASVPLRARAEDRTFAVKDVALEYRSGGPDDPFRTVPLADLAAAGDIAPALVGGSAPPWVRPVGVDAARSLPLASLVKPDGTAPADGDTVTLRVAATDWDDLAWTKGPGRSREVEIRVVSKAGLEAMFQGELAKLRPELLRAREDQRAAREAVAEVAKAAAAGKVTPDDAAKLAKAEQAQRDLRAKIADPADGLRATADRLRQALRSNTLPKSATADRVEAVADDLGKLADTHLEAAEPAIAAARAEADKAAGGGAKPDAKKLAAAADRAVREQQAAEGRLDAVLGRLEQWGGAGEVRGQARALKDQLGQAGAAAGKAADAVPGGKAPDDLTAREKQALEGPAGKLDGLAKQSDDLLGKAGRLADEKDRQAAALAATAAEKERQAAALAASAAEKGGTDEAAGLKAAADALKAEAAGLAKAAAAAAAEAEALRQAVRDAGGNALPADLRAAAEAQRNNQGGAAAGRRQDAAGRLDKLTEALSERKPADGPDELRKRRKDAAAEADALAQAQDELGKKARAAADLADPKARAEGLQKLAPEQDRLRRQAEQLAERLTRDREDKAADAVRQAAEKMADARGELEQGRPPAEKGDEALDKFDEALDKLEAEQKDAQERLTREKREELADQLKALRDRQAAAVAEAGRIHDAVLKAKAWTRGHQRSHADLDPAQKALAGELRGFADKQLADLPVFQRLAGQAAAAADRAARSVGEGGDRIKDSLDGDPFDPAAEASADERVRGPMRTALRRLDQILGSLKDDPKAAGAKPPAGGGGDGEGGPAGGEAAEAGGASGVPPLAQLKALRAVQAEVNERTAAFAKTRPDAAKFTDDDRDELKELETTQREIAELFDKLGASVRPSADGP